MVQYKIKNIVTRKLKFPIANTLKPQLVLYVHVFPKSNSLTQTKLLAMMRKFRMLTPLLARRQSRSKIAE